MKKYLKLMRLDEPIGIWLLLFPCWWAISLASEALNIKLLVIFFLGAVIMRSAGCIINDIIDIEYDKKVARTKDRPLANGDLTIEQAMIVLAVLLILAAIIAGLIAKKIVLILCFIALILVVTYPFMKRITWYPQLFLGVTFNFGALIGWASVKDSIDLPAIMLYCGGILWTLSYDTIYAHQDKTDDAKIGIKSTALRFGDKTKEWLALFYVGAVCFWFFAYQSIFFYGILFIILAHFYWQIKRCDLHNPMSCNKIFRSNLWIGLILFIGLSHMWLF